MGVSLWSKILLSTIKKFPRPSRIVHTPRQIFFALSVTNFLPFVNRSCRIKLLFSTFRKPTSIFAKMQGENFMYAINAYFHGGSVYLNRGQSLGATRPWSNS